jgi:hypothetical protein
LTAPLLGDKQPNLELECNCGLAHNYRVEKYEGSIPKLTLEYPPMILNKSKLCPVKKYPILSAFLQKKLLSIIYFVLKCVKKLGKVS